MQTKNTLYFVSPAVDMFFIGGFSILMFFALALLMRLEVDQTYVFSAAAVLTGLINWPHFAASSWRLYQSPQNIRQFPVTAILLPGVMLGFAAAAMLNPETVGAWWVKLFLIWSPYHFSAQTIGITLIYARRQGFAFDPLTRKLVSAFIYLTFLAPALQAEAGARDVRYAANNYYGIDIPIFGTPMWMADVMFIALGVIGVAALLRLLWRARASGVYLPLIVLVPALAQYVWFVPGYQVASFNTLVSAFHSLQYLFLAWIMQMHVRRQANPDVTDTPFFVFKESGLWSMANIFVGVFLFVFVPHIMTAITGASLMMSTAMMFVTVQVHHFFVDGVIWKLHDPKVQSPLMSTVDDVLHNRRAA